MMEVSSVRARSILRFLVDFSLTERLGCYLTRRYVKNHDAGDEKNCLLCAVQRVYDKTQHKLVFGMRRETFCGKCGLPTSAWQAHPCRGKAALVEVPFERSSAPRVAPIYWE
jgi:hypothetical protein